MINPNVPMVKSGRYIALRSMVKGKVAIVIRDTEANRGFAIPEDKVGEFAMFVENVAQEWGK